MRPRNCSWRRRRAAWQAGNRLLWRHISSNFTHSARFEGRLIAAPSRMCCGGSPRSWLPADAGRPRRNWWQSLPCSWPGGEGNEGVQTRCPCGGHAGRRTRFPRARSPTKRTRRPPEATARASPCEPPHQARPACVVSLCFSNAHSSFVIATDVRSHHSPKTACAGVKTQSSRYGSPGHGYAGGRSVVQADPCRGRRDRCAAEVCSSSLRSK